MHSVLLACVCLCGDVGFSCIDVLYDGMPCDRSLVISIDSHIQPGCRVQSLVQIKAFSYTVTPDLPSNGTTQWSVNTQLSPLVYLCALLSVLTAPGVQSDSGVSPTETPITLVSGFKGS